MAYLDMFILLSRYVFIGFIIVFIYISSTFIYNMPYELSFFEKHKVRLQYICIFFFNLAGYSILIAKQEDTLLKINLLKNGIIFMIIVTLTSWILKAMKRSREIPMYNIVLFLANVGIIMLERLKPQEANKQIIWCALGIGVAIVMPRLLKFFISPKFRKLYGLAGWIFILTPFFLGETKHGANNWIMIGEGENAFGFQPSEIVKILLVLYLASSLNSKREEKINYKELIVPMLVAGSFILCLVLQRDLGGGLIFFITTVTMLYVATNNILLYLLGIGSGSLAAIVGYKLFAHVRVRVEAWRDPWKDISGTGYQIVQGLFAIGTWGWFGSGLTRGYPDKIPVVTSDFIFAAICEEFGNLFGVGIIFLYLILILYSIRMIVNVDSEFLILLGIGIVNLIGVQVVLIIGGVIKLIPLTGVTLPFVSYGGSSMMVSLLMIGLLQYIGDHMEPATDGDSTMSVLER